MILKSRVYQATKGCSKFICNCLHRTTMIFFFELKFEGKHFVRRRTYTRFSYAKSNLPLIWNACPFHPHKPENPQNNRPPTQPELELGIKILTQLLKLFPDIKTLVAVGNRADHILTRHNISHLKVRHPSHGGKREFADGINRILANLN